jgi:hypothetical protein
MSLPDLRLYAAPSPALASDDVSTAASPTDRSGQFVAVTGPESEQVSASAMVIAAYGLFWLIAFAFIVLTYRSQIRLTARVAELEKKLPKDSQVS